MQSGDAKTNYWLLEYKPEGKKFADPLMGWTGGTDTKQQLKLKFATREKAIAYADSKNIPYEVIRPHLRQKVKKSYAENFAYKPAAVVEQ